MTLIFIVIFGCYTFRDSCGGRESFCEKDASSRFFRGKTVRVVKKCIYKMMLIRKVNSGFQEFI